MNNKKLNFLHAITSFIYDIKHISFSQWDVETSTKTDMTQLHDK